MTSAGATSRNFFFQAEDGIRDKLVTRVQTCALPISLDAGRQLDRLQPLGDDLASAIDLFGPFELDPDHTDAGGRDGAQPPDSGRAVERRLEREGRSEERRVGKECRSRGSPDY